MRVRAPRRAGAALLVVAIAAAGSLSGSGLPGARAAEAGSSWRPPVDGPVVAPFREPPARYAAGHRGVDYQAATGAPVRAANDGVVVFAGEVGGSRHVVLGHEHGIRTSYAFLADVGVSEGDEVRRGATIGHAGGGGPGHDPGVLHFGVRVGERYVDPMTLFAPADLAAMVQLVPSGERLASRDVTAEQEAAELGRWILEHRDDGCGSGIPLVGDVVSLACDAIAWSLDAGLDVVRAAGAAGERLAATLEQPLRELAESLVAVVEPVARRLLEQSPLGRVFLDVITMGVRFVEALGRECDSRPQPRGRPQGSGNVALAVGGIHSERPSGARGREPGPSFPLDPGALGYDAAEVEWFSYRNGSPTYDEEDTYHPILESAALLAQQLRDFAREHPGRTFDLIGHSQGGVVILAFLALIRPGHEAEYPPIEHVVTFASPLDGAPAATANEVLRSIPGLERLFDLLADRGLWPPIPPSGAASLADLSERSAVMERLESFRVPAGVRWTAITGSMDFVVPGVGVGIEGVDEITVDVGDLWNPFDDHLGILRDDDALAAAVAGLEGRPPPCQGIASLLLGAVAPVAIARLERQVADLEGAAALARR